MLSLTSTRKLLSIDTRNSNYSPIIQFLSIRYSIKTERLPPLLVDLSISYVFPTLLYSIFPEYILNLSIVCTRARTFSMRSRLTTLYLRQCPIYCVNTISYIDNSRKPKIVIPNSVLIINMFWTNVHRPPTGFFISIVTMSRNLMKQTRLRESTIKTCYDEVYPSKLMYVPKSIRDLTFPSMLTEEKLMSGFNVYNTPYRLRANENIRLGPFIHRLYEQYLRDP